MLPGAAFLQLASEPRVRFAYPGYKNRSPDKAARPHPGTLPGAAFLQLASEPRVRFAYPGYKDVARTSFTASAESPPPAAAAPTSRVRSRTARSRWRTASTG